MDWKKIPSLKDKNKTFKPLDVNFFSTYLFQECQEKCLSAINEVNIDLLSKKLHFFTKNARARTFAQIPSKPKNARNIHNSEFACKKSASYDNSKLCLNTVLIFRRVIRFVAPPFVHLR